MEQMISDIKDIIRRMKKEITCAICYRLLHDPVSTTCGHNFCRTCFKQMITNGDLSCPHCRSKWSHRSSYDGPRLSLMVSSVVDFVKALNEDVQELDLPNVSELSISSSINGETLEKNTQKRKKKLSARKTTKKVKTSPPSTLKKQLEVENIVVENQENLDEPSDKNIGNCSSSESDNFLLKVFKEPRQILEDHRENANDPRVPEALKNPIQESPIEAPFSHSILDLCSSNSDSIKSPIFVKSQELSQNDHFTGDQIVVIPETNFPLYDGNSPQKCSQSSQKEDLEGVTSNILGGETENPQNASPSEIIILEECSKIVIRDEQKIGNSCGIKHPDDDPTTQSQITRICSTLKEENEGYDGKPNPPDECAVITLDDSPGDNPNQVVEDSFVEQVDMTKQDSNDACLAQKFSFKLDKDQVIICCSGFTTSELKNYEILFESAFNVQITNKIDDRTSLLVTKTTSSSSGQLCVRTLKYFQALTRRIPILSHFWAEQCFKSKALVTDLDNFLVDGNTSDGPTLGAKISLHCKENELPFEHVYFYIIEPLDNFENKAELEDMIRRCNGSICQTLKDLQDLCAKSECAFIVCQQTSHQNTYFDDLFSKYTIPVIDVEYVLSCISHFQLLNGFENYLICSRYLFDRDFALRTQKTLVL